MVFGKLFGKGGGDKEDTAPRSLEHPKELQLKDIIKFGFGEQTGISGGEFTVTAINTYQLGDDDIKTVFVLEGINGKFYLSIRREGGSDMLEVGRDVIPEQVQEIFPWDDFLNILDPDHGTNNYIERTGELDELAGWTGKAYSQEAAIQGYFHPGDYRGKRLSSNPDSGEAFDYNLLVTSDRKHAFSIFVFDGGRTDARLYSYLPLSKVEEMWPASD